MKTILIIKGTHCRACKMLIEDVCKDNKDVASCDVNFESGRTEIEHTDAFDVEALKKEIEGLGDYKVELASHGDQL
jgi:copper chaperone CopZ